ncbi:Alpha-D-kanosaminyltransferase [Mucilaginibacter gotjawali]|nr:Alpha-D-kanosaminyltransferase [Mucilaginibacter gotjawali]
MMNWFCNNGYDTTIITTFPYYPFWKVQAPYTNWWYKKEIITYPETGATMTIHRCPIYIPNFPTGKKRMIQDMLLWPSKLWPVLNHILFKKKHDLLITIAPPFHLALMAFLYRRFRGGKVNYHIQDLQIEAARQLNIVVGAKLFRFLYKVEGYILRKSNYVSTISAGMVKKVKGKVDREVLFFPNWADTSFFYPLANRAEVKQKWDFKENDFICLYSGSIGEKQGLESIIQAAKNLRGIEQIKFVIAGTGPYKAELIRLAEEAGLTNVFFFPIQDKENFNAFLNMADIHLIIQKGNAGDLVMPSKLTTILAVGGTCIATAATGTSLYQVISDHNVGIVISSDDNDELASAIKNCLNKNLDEMRQNARAYALKYLNIDNVMNTFLNDVGMV